MSYRDLSLQNANKIMSIQDSFIIQLLAKSPPSNLFYESIMTGFGRKKKLR